MLSLLGIIYVKFILGIIYVKFILVIYIISLYIYNICYKFMY